jgi:hypothetical protein
LPTLPALRPKPLQATMVLAVIDQEKTKVDVDPILCAERRCRRSNNAARSPLHAARGDLAV